MTRAGRRSSKTSVVAGCRELSRSGAGGCRRAGPELEALPAPNTLPAGGCEDDALRAGATPAGGGEAGALGDGAPGSEGGVAGGGGGGGERIGGGGGGGGSFGNVTGGGGGGGGGLGSVTVGVVTGRVGVVIVIVGRVGRPIAPGAEETAAAAPAPASAAAARTARSRLPNRTFLQPIRGDFGFGLGRGGCEEQGPSAMPETAVKDTRDYYDVLGVARDTDADTIGKAFRARSRSLDPGISADPAALDRFRELSEAYAVLSKPPTRLLYDRFGYRRRSTAGNLSRRRTMAWGRKELCETCKGDGAARGAMTMACPACEGTGSRRVESSLAEGERLIQIDDCPACDGRGGLASDRCPACEGTGEMSSDETAVRYVAVLGLLVALVFLWLLLR